MTCVFVTKYIFTPPMLSGNQKNHRKKSGTAGYIRLFIALSKILQSYHVSENYEIGQFKIHSYEASFAQKC